MLSNWEDFMDMKEEDQAKFLLSCAKKSLIFIETDSKINSKLSNYINLASLIMDGKYENFHELIVFLNDNSMEDDFNNYYEILKNYEKDSAALDVISYACGFICRYAAKNLEITILPDPVIESVPEIYEYYKEKADILNI